MRVPIYINARDSGFHNTPAIIYSLANFDMTEQLFSFTHWLPMRFSAGIIYQSSPFLNEEAGGQNLQY